MGLKDIFRKSSSTTVPGKVKSFLNKDSTKAALSFTGIVASVAIDVFCDTKNDRKTNIDEELAYVDDDGQRHSNNGDLMW